MSEPDTEELLQQAAGGDEQAVGRLLMHHRRRLRRMVGVRMDPRMAGRVDPSDIVQEALVDASRRLKEYLRRRPIPFYPWLRQLAWERMVQQYRRHVKAMSRTVTRERSLSIPLPDQSAVELVSRIASRGAGPGSKVMQQELRGKVLEMLEKLKPRDREVLVLRFLEQLSTSEIASVLGLTPEGVKTRQRRALERFSRIMHNTFGEREE